MADAARTHTEGSLPFGTQAVTVYAKGATTGGVVYIAESISPTFGSDVIMSKNAVGVPYRKAIVEKEKTVTLTLQFPTDTTVPPAIGSYFALTPRGGSTAQQFDITEVGTPTEQSGEAKVSITAMERFNAVS